MLTAPSHYCATCWEFYAVEPTAVTNCCPKCTRVLTPRHGADCDGCRRGLQKNSRGLHFYYTNVVASGVIESACTMPLRKDDEGAVSHAPRLVVGQHGYMEYWEPMRYNQVKNGCWPAVLAGLTGIPHELLARHVPADNAFMHDDLAWATYYKTVLAELAAHGWTTQSIGQRVPKGYAVGIGKSVRGTDHAVIIRDGAVWHDPHESRAGVERFIDYEIVVPIMRSA